MESLPKSPAPGQLGFTFEAAAQPTQRRIWKVSELVAELRADLEREYADLWVEGEITDLRPASSGHIYFTLKDDSGQISTVLFRRQATLLRFRPENGLHILLRGRISLYEQRGQIQIIAEHLEPVGAGSLQLAFEQVKRALQQEGLFDADRKKPLPAFPRCVGIVTSPAGAVIRDFITVINRRHAALEILLYPALVQGETAAAEIAKGIAYFNQTREADLIVIARGGGSLEDLAPFNSESLARAIAASELPIVSAIGHETDFTIADFVSDLRAPTPSAAAEIITAAQHKVEDHLAQLAQRLQRAARYSIMQARERFARTSIDSALDRISTAINRRQQRVDELSFRIEVACRTQLQTRNHHLQSLAVNIRRHDPMQSIRLLRECIDNLSAKLTRAQKSAAQQRRSSLQSLERQLASLSPLSVLNRGYALVYNDSGDLLKRAADTVPGNTLSIRLASGSLESRVTKTKPEQDS